MTQPTASLFGLPGIGRARRRQRMLDVIQNYYAADRLVTFLAAFEQGIRATSTGLIEFIIDACLPRVPSLRFSGATALLPLYDPRLGPRRCTATAAEIALSLLRDDDADWSACFGQPACLRIADRVLPPAHRLEVHAVAGSARFMLETADSRLRIEAGFANGQWQVSRPQGCPIARLTSGIRLHSAASVRSQCTLPDGVAGHEVPVVTDDHVSRLEDALDLLRACENPYSEWVGSAINELVLIELAAGQMRSGSNFGWPGLAYLSLAPPTILAENLVHEASHQYAYVISKAENVDDGSDSELHFSPVTQRMRPLFAIALAYHAFANTYLFLGHCLRSSTGDERYALLRRELLRGQLAELAKPLATSPALTSTGRGLVGDLMAAVNSDG